MLYVCLVPCLNAFDWHSTGLLLLLLPVNSRQTLAARHRHGAGCLPAACDRSSVLLERRRRLLLSTELLCGVLEHANSWLWHAESHVWLPA